jgi:hypothetical protein
MSNNKRISLAKRLLVAAAAGLFSGIGAAADEPATQERSSAPSTRVSKERYLLLTDGRLVRGLLSRDDTTYTVTQKLGVIRFPKKQVERSFETVQEAYQYKLARIPEDDPAERVRLARWCLNLHLSEEAKSQLEKVLEISPDHGPAKAMLAKIVQSEATAVPAAESKVDERVQQAGAEEVVEDRPGALDSAVLRGAERRMGITGKAVIFDLPQPIASRRAEEFKQYIHPILQAYCAKCHNADYPGLFQLEPVKAGRQRTSDSIRANLDATLRLVDPENPAKSELLSSTLRPHGLGPRKRPIFPGSNNRAYQILAAWVNSLRPAAGPDGTTSERQKADDADEPFAADRGRFGPAPLDQFARGINAGDPRRLPANAKPAAQAAGGPAYRYAEGQGMVPEDLQQADPREFPLPYMMGGPRPIVPGAGASREQRTADSQATRAARTPGEAPIAARKEPGASPDDRTAGTPAGPETADPRSSLSSGSSKAKKKPVKIDPAVLERLLQRNANRTPTE